MNLQEAIKLAEQVRESKVVVAGDLGDRWIFSFEDDAGKTGGLALFVFKDSGDCEVFGAADYVESLMSGEFQYRPVKI